MSKVDQYVAQSYTQYKAACEKFIQVPVDEKEYRDLLYSAATALKECTDLPNDGHPYVMVKVGGIYMKAMKVGDDLRISFLDEDAFKVITQYKENKQ